MQNFKNFKVFKIPSKCLTQRFLSSEAESVRYQFMHRSKLPSLHFQKSLPRLPVPKLNITCDRFLSATKPLLNPEEHHQTAQILLEFQKGDGAKLHAMLEDSNNANKHTSYISQPWFDMYLSDRSPLPINYNPVLIMKADTRKGYQNQILRATNLVISSMRFWKSLQADLLEPEIYHLNAKKTDTQRFRNMMRFVPQGLATYAAYAFKAFPLDMSQYNRIFGVSRVPKKGKDLLVQYKNSKHILVMRGGNMYSVDVLDDNGNIENPNVILARLRTVLHIDDANGASPVPIGPLTSINRDEWAAVREHLIHNVGGDNKYLLEKEIDAALFCLCLDKSDDPVYNENNMEPFLKNVLAGNGKNRWFDKSVSLLLGADGTAALNFEHSWGDGIAVLRYFNEVYKDITDNPHASPNMDSPTLSDDKSIRHLKLKTDKTVEDVIQKAILNNSQIMNQLNIDILRYPFINKVICKKHGLSPDAVMQLSFQLAYKIAFNDYVGTYESCSTAAFRHGRTETVRPCTMATKEFCESYLKGNSKRPNSTEFLALIRECSNFHSKLTKEAAMGQGFDRHLFALKHQALSHNKSIPLLYDCKAFAKLNHNIISTSTLSSNALLHGSFGPVVKDGLGIAYTMQNEYCGAVVTSYEKQRNGRDFVENLQTALDHIYGILKSSLM